MNKLNILLLVLVSVSAFSVVTVQNQSRLHFIALDKAQKQEIKLDQDYARLKLDSSFAPIILMIFLGLFTKPSSSALIDR